MAVSVTVGVSVGVDVLVADGIGEGVIVFDESDPPPPVSGWGVEEGMIWFVCALWQAEVRKIRSSNQYLVVVWDIFTEITCK